MISATIITLNEEKRIEDAIKSLKKLADEIIIVDSGSTDKTKAIAEGFGAKVYVRKFDNFANQKNFAASKTTGDWILAIDADEEIPINLAKEIEESVKSDQYVGYLMPRRNFILGKEIKFSRWSPDTHIWLWKKGHGEWIGDVHEEVVVKGKIGVLKNSKIHKSHESASDFMRVNNFYSTLEAKSLFIKHTKFSYWKLLWEPVFEFCIRFIYKLGFLDGKEGFVLAYLMGIYRLTVWVKVWELEKQKQ